MNIVFGSGMYVVNHWKYIEKYFQPDYLISNSKKKWGCFNLGGLVCKPPEEVLSQHGKNIKVLIAVSNHEDIQNIKKQLGQYNVEIQTIFEFLEENSCKEPIPEKFLALRKTNDRKFLLVNVAEHDNIGDHLITIAEKEFFRHRFPQVSCIEISDIEYLWFHRWLKEHIRPTDVLFLTGGGFLGSLYLNTGEFAFRKLILDYPDHPIITFPQTLYFEENPKGEKIWQTSREVYNSHRNLAITLRESRSYRTAKDLVGDRYIDLTPDIVLSMDYSRENTARGGKGVNVCLRTDKESVVSPEERERLCTALSKSGYHTFFTSMHSGCAINERTRKRVCENKREEILDSDIVITDTLHCMILCAITGTPCIAIDTISHKVKYVYDWIRNLGYIKLAKNTQEIMDLMERTIALGKSAFPVDDMQTLFLPLENRIREAVNLCPRN